MGKELIRNGGFERGTMAFWDDINVLSAEVLAAAKQYGTYGCKVISSGDPLGLLVSRDFIPVDEEAIYFLSAWVKNSVSRDVYLYINEYDSDLSFIDGVSLTSKTIGTTFEQMLGIYKTHRGCSYIKLGFVQDSFSINDYSYIDSISCKELTPDKIAVLYDRLIQIYDETTKHTVIGEEFFTGIWKHAEYFLDVISFSETGASNPVTLNVKIETLDYKTNVWRDAMVFQELSCPLSDSVTTQEYKSLQSNLGWKQRVSYTTGGAGTIGDCDFKVGVVYKR